jgi:hypothetical protein
MNCIERGFVQMTDANKIMDIMPMCMFAVPVSFSKMSKFPSCAIILDMTGPEVVGSYFSTSDLDRWYE